MVAERDVYELARLYADRLTVAQAAARVGGTQEEIRQLLRDGRLPRIPDRSRPVRVDHLEQLVADGWLFGDPAHRGRIPTLQAARRLRVMAELVSGLAGPVEFELARSVEQCRRACVAGVVRGTNRSGTAILTAQIRPEVWAPTLHPFGSSAGENGERWAWKGAKVSAWLRAR